MLQGYRSFLYRIHCVCVRACVRACVCVHKMHKTLGIHSCTEKLCEGCTGRNHYFSHPSTHHTRHTHKPHTHVTHVTHTNHTHMPHTQTTHTPHTHAAGCLTSWVYGNLLSTLDCACGYRSPTCAVVKLTLRHLTLPEQTTELCEC